MDGREQERDRRELEIAAVRPGGKTDKTVKMMTEDLDLIRVVDVEYLHDYTMLLEFSNGEKRIVDFLPLLKGKRHEELKRHENFIQFALTSWTLEWYNGVDFAPDYLYMNGIAA